MALITPELASEGLHIRTLFEESYVCVLRQGHPAAKDAVDLDAFCRFDHAIMSHDGTRFKGATDVALEGRAQSTRCGGGAELHDLA